MFERYTERARRVIFFARYEASQFGSMTIETEHLLLGLIKEDRNLIHRFLHDPSSARNIRDDITQHLTVGVKVPTSIDLPLSNECERILAYAAEEAEHLDHRHIGVEHLLIGILREEKSLAAQILHRRGLTLASVREELAHRATPAANSELQPSVNNPDAPVPSREELHKLVDSLPEGALVAAIRTLQHFQVWPPVPPDPLNLRKQMEERRLELRNKIKPGTIGGMGGSGGYDPTRGAGSSSFHYWDGDTFVAETHRHHQGHDLTIIERLRLETGKQQLIYKHEITGPGGKRDEREITFEL